MATKIFSISDHTITVCKDPADSDPEVRSVTFHFCSNFPARRIPKVKVTRTPNVIAMNPAANRATGKTPLVKATCIVKYLVKPEK